MGIIRSQSIKSTIITYIGFSVGAINLVFIMPNFLTTVQIGLISVYIVFTTQMVAIGSLGIGVVINKFLPYYRQHLEPKKNDLLPLALIAGTFGMILIMGLSIACKDFVIRKFSRNSPLFIEYLYLFPSFVFGYLYYYILDSFNNNYKFTIWSSFVRELFYKLFNLSAALIFAIHWLSFKGVMILYSVMYWFGALLIMFNLSKSKLFYLPFKLSSLTKRLKSHLLKYSLSTWGINILGIASQFIDTFAIAGLVGLGSAAIYNIPKFLVTAIIIPSSSVLSISVPLISDAWRRNDLLKIEEIYKKSALVLVLLCGSIFFLIWTNIDDILRLLPNKFYGSDANFSDAKYVILFLGGARMCDFATSVNGYILQNSRKYYWIDLYSNIFLILMIIPLNYFMIKKFGFLGAGYANFIAFFVINSLKAIYLYAKEKIHPFSKKWWLMGVFFLAAILIGYCLNLFFNYYLFNNILNTTFVLLVRMSLRVGVLCAVFIPMIYWLKISDDINGLIDSILRKITFKNKN